MSKSNIVWLVPLCIVLEQHFITEISASIMFAHLTMAALSRYVMSAFILRTYLSKEGISQQTMQFNFILSVILHEI